MILRNILTQKFISKKKIIPFGKYDHTKENELRFGGEMQFKDNLRIGNFLRFMDKGSTFAVELCAGKFNTGDTYVIEDKIILLIAYRLIFNDPSMMMYALEEGGGDEVFRNTSYNEASCLDVITSVEEKFGGARSGSFVVIYRNRKGYSKKETDAHVLRRVVEEMEHLVEILKQHRKNKDDTTSLLDKIKSWSTDKLHPTLEGGVMPPFGLTQWVLDLAFVGDYYDRNLTHVGVGAVAGISLALGKTVGKSKCEIEEAFWELTMRLNENEQAVRSMIETTPVLLPDTKSDDDLFRFHVAQHGTCEFHKMMWNLSSSHLWSILGEWKGRGIQEFDWKRRNKIMRHGMENDKKKKKIKSQATEVTRYTPDLAFVFDYLVSTGCFVKNDAFK